MDFQQVKEHDWGLTFTDNSIKVLTGKKLFSGLDEIIAYAQQSGKSAMLVLLENAEFDSKIFELHQLGEKFRYSDTKFLRIAIVLPEAVDFEKQRFLNNVFFNRGARLQFFDTTQEAREWLLESDH